jgi:hypothetical protein
MYLLEGVPICHSAHTFHSCGGSRVQSRHREWTFCGADNTDIKNNCEQGPSGQILRLYTLRTTDRRQGQHKSIPPFPLHKAE